MYISMNLSLDKKDWEEGGNHLYISYPAAQVEPLEGTVALLERSFICNDMIKVV